MDASAREMREREQEKFLHHNQQEQEEVRSGEDFFDTFAIFEFIIFRKRE